MIEKWKKEEKKSSLVGDVVIQTIPLTGRRCSTLANNRKLSKHPVTKNTKKQGKQNTDISWNLIGSVKTASQLAFTCLKSTIETLEKGVKYVQN